MKFSTICTYLAFIIIFNNTAFAQNAFFNFEGKQVAPIRISPDGTRLFAVNTPDARLSVFDLSTPSTPKLIKEIPVGIEPVSVNPISNNIAWVVNEVSDSVSVVDVNRGIVIRTLAVGDEPADVVFAGTKAFVSVSRINKVIVFDINNYTKLATISLSGGSPRALAVNTAGTKVYVAFALSGNRTTIIPAAKAPPQDPPTNPALPPPPQVGMIVDATDSNWSSVIHYTMPDNDVAEIDVTTMAVTKYFTRTGTINLALAIQPGTGNLYVANTDARNLIDFEPTLRGHIVNNRITKITLSSGSKTYYDLNPGLDYSVLPNPTAKSKALAQPTSIAFDASGSFMYLTSFGTDRVAKVGSDGVIQARIEIGSATGANVDSRHKKGPRGLALLSSKNTLYVLNRFSNTISSIDTLSNAVVSEKPVGNFDPTPAVIKNGRGFLYDAKLSGNGTASCASCHVDAEMDMLAWDLGNPGGSMQTVTQTIPGGGSSTVQIHPMKGPMTTQTLRGLNGVDPLHWRGDRATFNDFNPAFDSLMGGTQLVSSNMQAYADYVHTIKFEPNPFQKLDRTLPATHKNGDPNAGKFTFMNETFNGSVRCVDCHTSPGPGTNKLIISGTFLLESQPFKVAQLRNIYQKLNFNDSVSAKSVGGFGLLHDGSKSSVYEFLTNPVFGSFANDDVRKRNLEAFIECFDTGTAPSVGYAITPTSSTITSTSVTADLGTLEGQATAKNCDLIVKGTIDGQVRGLLYVPTSNNYKTDKTGVGPFTRSQLVQKVQAGDVLTFMGVPPGSGNRMGIDRNANGILDGD